MWSIVKTKLEYNFELISKINQLFVHIYLFHSYPNTENARKVDGTCLFTLKYINILYMMSYCSLYISFAFLVVFPWSTLALFILMSGYIDYYIGLLLEILFLTHYQADLTLHDLTDEAPSSIIYVFCLRCQRWWRRNRPRSYVVIDAYNKKWTPLMCRKIGWW